MDEPDTALRLGTAKYQQQNLKHEDEQSEEERTDKDEENEDTGKGLAEMCSLQWWVHSPLPAKLCMLGGKCSVIIV